MSGGVGVPPSASGCPFKHCTKRGVPQTQRWWLPCSPAKDVHQGDGEHAHGQGAQGLEEDKLPAGRQDEGG